MSSPVGQARRMVTVGAIVTLAAGLAPAAATADEIQQHNITYRAFFFE